MSKFRKKPVVIEAEQFHKDKFPYPKGVYACGAYRATHGGDMHLTLNNAYHLYPVYKIKTLEGELIVSHLDWIITGIKGEQYPCKPDIFQAMYEPVPLDSKPKEELIEGLAETRVSIDTESCIPGATLMEVRRGTLKRHSIETLLAYLSSPGFGDIEQAKKEGAKEERERIFRTINNGCGHFDRAWVNEPICRECFEALKQEGK